MDSYVDVLYTEASQLESLSLDNTDYTFNTITYNDIAYDLSGESLSSIDTNTQVSNVQAFFTAINEVSVLTNYRTLSITLSNNGQSSSDVVDLTSISYSVTYTLDDTGDIAISTQIDNTGLQYVEGWLWYLI